jgi:hypothetical protein
MVTELSESRTSRRQRESSDLSCFNSLSISDYGEKIRL